MWNKTKKNVKNPQGNLLVPTVRAKHAISANNSYLHIY